MEAKKTKGRQKIQMERIADDDARMVTFSKRKSGIFKKASELATLTGAETGILIFSPSGKPFTFGHPSLESVSNRLPRASDQPPSSNTHPLVEAQRQVRINRLNNLHNQLIQQLDEEKAKEKVLREMAKGKETETSLSQRWWETSVQELNLQQLLEREATCDDLHRALVSKLNEKTAAAGASSSMDPPRIPDQPGN